MAYKGKLLSQMKGAEKAARLRQLAANPATRHLVPTASLSVEAQKERLKNAYLDSPVAAGSDLSNRALAHQRDAATSLQFGEQQSALDQAKRQSDLTQSQIGDWYGNYQQQLKSIQDADRARQDQVAGQISNFGQGAAALSAADNSRVNQEQVNDAALRGATPDARLAAQGLQAARSRDSLNAAFGALQSLQGQAADRYASGRIANAGLSAIEAHQREAGNAADLSEKQRLLGAQEGAYKADYVTKARQQERQYGLDTQHAAAEKAIAGVKAKTDDAKFKAQYGVTPAQAASMSTGDLLALQKKVAAAKRGPAKPAKPPVPNSHGYLPAEWAKMTVAERRRIIAADKSKPAGSKPLKDSAGSLGAKQAILSAKAVTDEYKRKGASRARATQLLEQRHPEYGPVTMSSALDLSYLKGRLSQKNIGRLRTGGIRIPNDWLT